jgi:hypothetical protein
MWKSPHLLKFHERNSILHFLYDLALDCVDCLNRVSNWSGYWLNQDIIYVYENHFTGSTFFLCRFVFFTSLGCDPQNEISRNFDPF